MRLFVAVYPPQESVDDLAAYLAGLRLGRAAADGVNTRLVAPATWHITLAFLGEVEDDRLDAVRTAIGEGVQRWAARAPAGQRAPALRVAGGGRFGRGRFTVLWTGVRGDVEPLKQVAWAVRRALKRARLPHDDRPPKPHLTIARPGAGLAAEAIAADLAALAGYQGPQWTADQLALMRSQLGAQPTYDRLGSWPLDPAQWPGSRTSTGGRATRPTPPGRDHRYRSAGTARRGGPASPR